VQRAILSFERRHGLIYLICRNKWVYTQQLV
jgi:hypothetical protein